MIDAQKEMSNTLALLPQLEAIYFCPDLEDRICCRINKNEIRIFEISQDKYESGWGYRKPDAGMIHLAATDSEIDLSQSWMIGDRREDADCAAQARLNFMWAERWRNRFLPGMHEIKQVSVEEIEFLEGVKISK